MGKQGPCYHCGVTSTPLWRNGPPEKPVLCNACGSRWRTKGTLANYTPLHARTETADFEDQRVSRVKIVSSNKNKEVKLVKRKQNHGNAAFGGVTPEYIQGFQKVVDEDTSNRSSSGSAVSNSESCAQFGGIDASDFTGPSHSQSVVWDATVPSKRRTCAGRPKHSSVEKLTKDLCSILHEQQSYFSTTSEEELLFESETPMVSVEIGHGSMLIRHPGSIAREEESEASSLSVDNKHCLVNEAYSYSGSVPMLSDCTGMNLSSLGVEKIGNSAGHKMQQEQLKMQKTQLEKLEVLGNHDSPLCLIDLNDVVNYEEFSRNLTNEEKQQLVKYLPGVDTAKLPDSLKTMFDSFQFKENITCFQQLLGEGVLDLSLFRTKPEDCKTLKRLALSNLSKSKWIEHYNFLKSHGNKNGKCDYKKSPDVVSSNVANVKRPRDSQNQNFTELRTIMRSPKRLIIKAGCEGKEVVDGFSFSPQSLFALPRDDSGLRVLDSSTFIDESSDLLLEVPSNNYFPQAELLLPPSSSGAQASTSSNSVYSHVTRP